jgi:hypothetical protein
MNIITNIIEHDITHHVNITKYIIEQYVYTI